MYERAFLSKEGLDSVEVFFQKDSTADDGEVYDAGFSLREEGEGHFCNRAYCEPKDGKYILELIGRARLIRDHLDKLIAAYEEEA